MIVINCTVKISHLRRQQIALLHVFFDLSYTSRWCFSNVWNSKYRWVRIWLWGLSHHCHNPFHKSQRFLFPNCMGSTFLWQFSYNVDSSWPWQYFHRDVGWNHQFQSCRPQSFFSLLFLPWTGVELCYPEVKKLLLIPRASWDPLC